MSLLSASSNSANLSSTLQSARPPLLITTGEPAGIGMDIVLSLAASGELSSSTQPIWVTADAQALDDRAARLIANGALTQKPTWRVIENTQVAIDSALLCLAPDVSTESAHTADLVIIDVPAANPIQAGVIDVANAAMVAEQLALAHQLAIENKIAAIVTGPLQKSALIEADIRLDDGTMFSGHTEYFMQKSGCDKVVMMLANDAMKVALVTTHLPLRDVPAAITKANVEQTVQIVLDDLRSKFGLTQPKVLVCGLNPHAGEGGHLGMEEIEIINPVLDTFRGQGVDISEAMPADTLFTPRHLADCDAVIAMYHDQGLPVLKSHGFGDTVNLTLGLPYIRTSVDHGTALDLAGTGKASASSLKQALTMAQSMAASR
ncbi:4-hydroxythreonine-4-phosphate dehydrogenase PdxA [Psychrobacter arenosus]|uniref:4-hydroxythreonine-4-phosphate dehydrogenase PdxA n=1 Tax=Psychrobacter arenosus TaxID=256326 RepID=UPI00191B1798|nr:4-hydroxythreonine-4-phosphate dehydrogenase PdxA [Psychrobacter arenosus]